jgi:hypothetical protein
VLIIVFHGFTWLQAEIEENIMQDPPNSQEGTQVGSMMYHHNDAYSKSMGKERHGRVRGYGLGITPSSLPGHGSSQPIASASTPEDAQELTALRIEVAELRRQREVKL